eukprot:15735567-Heterocapsa_arctica.AAC.1
MSSPPPPTAQLRVDLCSYDVSSIDFVKDVLISDSCVNKEWVSRRERVWACDQVKLTPQRGVVDIGTLFIEPK